MHDLLFRHQDALDPEDLSRYATDSVWTWNASTRDVAERRRAARVDRDVEIRRLSVVSVDTDVFHQRPSTPRRNHLRNVVGVGQGSRSPGRHGPVNRVLRGRGFRDATTFRSADLAMLEVPSLPTRVK